MSGTFSDLVTCANKRLEVDGLAPAYQPQRLSHEQEETEHETASCDSDGSVHPALVTGGRHDGSEGDGRAPQYYVYEAESGRDTASGERRDRVRY